MNVADDVGAPQFVKRPKDQRVVEGNAAFFSCDVTSDPPLPRIHWNKDGKLFSTLSTTATANSSSYH